MTSGHWLAGTRPVRQQGSSPETGLCRRKVSRSEERNDLLSGDGDFPEPRHKQAFSLGLPLRGSSSSKWGYLGVLVTILDPLTVAFPSPAQNALVPQMRKFSFDDQCSSCNCHTGSDGDRWLLGYRSVRPRAHWAPPQQ